MTAPKQLFTLLSHTLSSEFTLHDLREDNELATALLNEDGVIQAVSPAFCELFGYDAESLIAHSFSSLLSTSHHHIFFRLWKNLDDTHPYDLTDCAIKNGHHENHAVTLSLHKVSHEQFPQYEHPYALVHIRAFQLANTQDAHGSESDPVPISPRAHDFMTMAGTVFWEMNAELSYLFFSDRMYSMTGITITDALTLTHLQLIDILLEDGNQKTRHVKAIQQRQPFNLPFTYSHPEGEHKSLRFIGKPFWNEQGYFDGYRGVIKDETDLHNLKQQLQKSSTVDDVTGLMNRSTFEHKLQEAVREVKDSAAQHALCLIDLDQFKLINDTAGHAAGDTLLKRIATLLADTLRTSDTIARLGGDEFAVLLRNCSVTQAKLVADKLLRKLASYKFMWSEQLFTISASIGLVPIHANNNSSTDFLAHADIACYAAKDLGRNRVQVYHAEAEGLSQQHIDLNRVVDIRQALTEERFELYYQTITPLQTNNNLHPYYEVLLRLKDKDGSILSPGHFIPAAERYNLMQLIDRWVIKTVLTNFSHLFNHLNTGHIAINLSGNSLTDPDLLEFTKQQFQNTTVSPERICFEITETAVISNVTHALEFINGMRALGCKFALDDFGSGLSSFAYLKRFPVDFLKIDGTLVRDMHEDYTDQVMVKAINDIGQAMKVSTIAEFVETDAEVQLLRQLSVDYAQGYVFSKPAPLHLLLKTLQTLE